MTEARVHCQPRRLSPKLWARAQRISLVTPRVCSTGRCYEPACFLLKRTGKGRTYSHVFCAGCAAALPEELRPEGTP
jgi:hypothetical protein